VVGHVIQEWGHGGVGVWHVKISWKGWGFIGCARGGTSSGFVRFLDFKNTEDKAFIRSIWLPWRYWKGTEDGNGPLSCALECAAHGTTTIFVLTT
jgi:hypothetical protein